MRIATYYLNNPAAPKTNQPIHLGANILISCRGKLLLEHRTDCDEWGLIGGGRKKGETQLQNALRELREETGIIADAQQLRFVKTYDNPGRIASYRDGSVWAMVISVYLLSLSEVPNLQCSKESKELQFFSPEEIRKLPIVLTHSDIISDFLSQTP